MGPAAAVNAMSDPNVSEVVLCDFDQQQLDAARVRLRGMEGAGKLSTAVLDVNDQRAATKLMERFDAVVGTLTRGTVALGMPAAVAAGTPLVDLARPVEAELPDVKREVEAAGGPVVWGYAA